MSYFSNLVIMRKLLYIFFLFSLHLSFSQKIFSVQYKSQADIKIFVVEYKSQADLCVYKVDYKSQAGWNKKGQKHLLY